MTTRRTLLAAGLAAPALAPAGSLAQSAWPERPVRVIVPWPPGGSTDVLCRIMCERLQAITGQSFVIENRPGAGGNIGADAVAKATPDGYTMGPLTLTVWSIAQFLYARLPFDTDRDFQPVSLHWELPNVFVVSTAHTPARTAQEFVTFAKARQGGVSYGSPGIGTTAHLCGSLFVARNGIDGVHVPFRGAAQTIPAMLSGDVTFAIDNLASYVPVIQEGRMRALAVTSATRHPALPDVPTMAEAGIPNFTVQSWCAFGMPAGVPAPIVARASELMQQVANEPATKERFLRTGAHAIGSSPDGVWERARRERPLWQEMVRISGARLE
ncbi:tripartite tricarboxylate transporter substrate binding protein [Roseococcus sp. SDR]|uniref:Bug family tripartite tricarboxylate transporter substrate binding protein n=1 Tax=Roseococcus sp. SDR TaxID=2835532 RepID=UPI001BD1B689|nr:tripartite tricarboxylate transporter substrate binding protein [Roseococcus sp. SDR]MBS7789707.1 tripartite tricarboxylate transporter substrate binding protein [Roseococcus sp. SDR]MBV1845021.1 tripartite tricarboxylate transporter substrate binding protein [Roseococcus sp. SDR]